MLPKPVRAVFYWILRSGGLGRLITDIVAWVIYGWIKFFKIRPRQDIAGLTIISHKYKFIFFGIPKVASRSFFNYFVKKQGKNFEIEWHEKRDVFFELKKSYPDYFTFSFVRDPWSRIVSCYKSKIEKAVIGKRARIHSFYKNLSPTMRFEDFCQWLLSPEGQDDVADRHWISQYLFVTNDNGQMICDFIGKYETLDDDWRQVCGTLNIPYEPLDQKGFISAIGKNKNPEIIEENLSGIRHNDSSQYYDDETKQIIAKRYKKDFEVFGYDVKI